jgi:hypothetical protein
MCARQTLLHAHPVAFVSWPNAILFSQCVLEWRDQSPQGR